MSILFYIRKRLSEIFKPAAPVEDAPEPAKVDKDFQAMLDADDSILCAAFESDLLDPAKTMTEQHARLSRILAARYVSLFKSCQPNKDSK